MKGWKELDNIPHITKKLIQLGYISKKLSNKVVAHAIIVEQVEEND